jgi:hypothetical protein
MIGANNTGGGCGAGDVAGVSLGDGSENVMEDGLEGTEEVESVSTVPVGEPSGVKTAGWRVVEFVRRCVNWPLSLRNCGCVQW